MNVLQTPRGLVPVQTRGGFLSSAQAPRRLYGSGSGSVSLLGDFLYSYAWVYRTQPWVYAVVNKLTRGMARLPLKVYRQDAGGEREIVRDSFAAVLRAPMPRASAWDLKTAIFGSLAVYGNSLVVKRRQTLGAPPNELWPVQWPRVEVYGGKGGPIDLYVVRDNEGKPYPFLPDEVVHLRLWSPNLASDGQIGLSPLEPLRRTVMVEDASTREIVAAFANAGRPSGAFVTERSLTREKVAELREELEQLYGGVDNAYRIAILQGGLEWRGLASTHEEQQLVPIRKLSREEVCAVYDIPPPMVGILDKATYSNISTQHAMLYQDVFGPWLVQAEEGLEAQLIRPEPEWDGLDLEFDLSEVLKGDTEKRMKAYMAAIQVGVTPDEIRHWENLPPLGTPAAKQGYVQRNLMPLDGASPDDSALTPPTP